MGGKAMTMIGRDQECQILETLFRSSDPEFLAIYGRRRVGKTYLIREFFKNKLCEFITFTGLKNGSTKKQLTNFTHKLSVCFYNGAPLRVPANWHEAFLLLTKEIQKIKNKKIILFFDELPWLVTRRSGLIEELDYYWNTNWSQNKNFVLITCGSAASWMLDNLIHAKGGLHNRLTKIIQLKPFDLQTTHLFLKYYKHRLSKKQTLDLYLCLGGIPYYLKHLDNSLSVIQNIDRLYFEESAFLQDEFHKLFHSLFNEPETNIQIILKMARSRYGISRETLLNQLKIHSGGTFNKRIQELKAADFIDEFIPFGKRRDIYYKIKDEFILFYLKWLYPEIKKGLKFSKNYWASIVNSSSFHSWAGYSFESVCIKHAEEIRRALHLNNIGCKVGNWLYQAKNKNEVGAQIDLLFDREDNAITLCEIKFSTNKYAIDKSTAKNLLNKIDTFEKQTKTKKQLFLALITTDGLKQNLYSEELIQQLVTLDDLM